MPTYLHSGDLGDIIYALPTIKHIGAGMLYLTTRRTGQREEITPASYEFIKPLLESQPYITGVEMHKGQKITHDFTGFREGLCPNTTLAELQRRHLIHNQNPDFDSPWITLPPEDTMREIGIIISRSARYHNPVWAALWPKALKMGHCQFVGLREEYEAFCAEFGRVDYLKVQNALELAEAIGSAELFIGNQSLPFAIAEGMKVKRILEVEPTRRDSEYKGGSVTHVLTANQWPEKATGSVLMLALQFWPGDAPAALELAELICMLESRLRDDVEIAVCPRDDCHPIMVENIRLAFLESFSQVHVLTTMRRGSRGWPMGPNDLWQSTMIQLGEMKRYGQTKAEAVLTFEPDCVPGSVDWIDRLAREWRVVADQNKLAFGHMHAGGGPEGPKMHINGNMVIDITAIRKFPELQTSKVEWDISHGKLFVAHGVHSDLILNTYRNHNVYTTDQFMEIKQNGVRPAMIHGIKNDSGRKAVIASLNHPPE